MNLETMINNVLPEGSILYKHNHGLFDFYLNDMDFEDGEPFSEMKVDEGFSDFIHRTIGELIQKEEGTENPSTAIDFLMQKKTLTMHINKAIEAIYEAIGLKTPGAIHDIAINFDDEGNVTYLHYVSNQEKCVKCFSEVVHTEMSENGDGNYVTSYLS